MIRVSYLLQRYTREMQKLPGYAEWADLMGERIGLLYARQDVLALERTRPSALERMRVACDASFSRGMWFETLAKVLRVGWWRRDVYPTRDHAFMRRLPTSVPSAVREAAVATLVRLKGYSSALAMFTRSQNLVCVKLCDLQMDYAWLDKHSRRDVRHALDRVFHQLESARIVTLRDARYCSRYPQRVTGSDAMTRIGARILELRPDVLSTRNRRSLGRILSISNKRLLLGHGVLGRWCWWKGCRTKGFGLCDAHGKTLRECLETCCGIDRDSASVVQSLVG